MMSKRDLISAYLNYLVLASKTYLHFLLPLKRMYRNYLAVAYRMKRMDYPITAILRNGDERKYYRPEEIRFDLAHISYDVNADLVTIDDLKFAGGIDNGDIVGIFVDRDYEIIPAKDKVVIDIGANIADSSIYFASRGARKVYALEPNEELYLLAKKNISLNSMSDRIELTFAGCSTKRAANSSPPLLTLEELIRSYKLEPDVLKVDCEGCEYDIIMNSPVQVLQTFEFILIEYHYGHRELKKVLEKCGFNVRVTGPVYCPQIVKPIKAGTRYCISDSQVVREHVMKPYMGYLFAFHGTS